MFDVVHVTPSLDLAHGGPSRTVPALAAAQAALGARVALVAAGEAPADFAAMHPGVALKLFPLAGGMAGRVFRFSPGLAEWLAGPEARAGAVHAHGVWLRPLHHARLAATRHGAPFVLAPRGMLEPWARGHHAWKKRLAGALIHPGALRAVDGWHATSDEEAANLGAISAAPTCVAPNGVELPEAGETEPARTAWLAAHPALRDRRVALFYGRFHRKKRVAELIELWRSADRPGWVLLVAGLEGEWTVAGLRELAGRGDRNAPVVVADGSSMPRPYALAECFLLPSHSENFGQAVAEALAAGVPALVTDTLPWRGLDAAGAGMCVSWADYGTVLEAWTRRTPEANAALGRAGRLWVEREFTWRAPAQRLLAFCSDLQSHRQS